ncbi:(-)-germacrene D synthase-like [Pyrus ussuriensis x Pyrus communis]|uniref:(-)-germacrene D synthase-like n=1 Tax=Pyrus ussuriensis x Pyrus communis TaxID=2448454 RepID=A0A5N5HYQ5_9ROSA|nr:(-)-germacrene D synthase-like [Pyrus ussuriensis x Pyrus communis]
MGDDEAIITMAESPGPPSSPTVNSPSQTFSLRPRFSPNVLATWTVAAAMTTMSSPVSIYLNLAVLLPNTLPTLSFLPVMTTIQQGYNVSCDIFNKFKDGDGKFMESLVDDIGIPDVALTFTTTHLESATDRLSSPLAKTVTHALNQQLRKGLPRVEATYYLSVYQELRESPNETLLTFAKLDFNRLQRVHQKELNELTRWWKDLDVPNKLPFVRDRLVEVYFCWSLSVYIEPQYSFATRTSCKVTAITSIIDDFYDAYGTYEELELFTEAIETMDQLPEYMKVCYRALLDIYSEIHEKLAREGKLYHMHHAREAILIPNIYVLIRGYFNEAKLFRQKHIPSLDEYMPVSLVTSAYPFLITTSFVGMEEAAIDSFDWLLTSPQAVKAASTVGRLMNDIVNHKQKKEHFVSAVNCYMKKYGATEEEAIIELQRQVNNAWKDINEACLRPTAVPMPLLIRFLNFSRVPDVVYKCEDSYTNPEGFVLFGSGWDLLQSADRWRKQASWRRFASGVVVTVMDAKLLQASIPNASAHNASRPPRPTLDSNNFFRPNP